MATYLECLTFKNRLPWYKKILFPLFLNKKECEEYIRIMTEKRSELDKARDYYFFCWNEYMKSPTYETKKRMEMAKDVVKIILSQENRYYEDTYRSNEDVNYWLKRDIIV